MGTQKVQTGFLIIGMLRVDTFLGYTVYPKVSKRDDAEFL